MRRAAPLVLLLASCDDFARLGRLKPHLLTVTAIDRYTLPDGGEVLVPADSASGLVMAQVKVDGEGWLDFEGRWVDAGVAELALPEGWTYISRPDRVYNFEPGIESTLDLGNDFLGRPWEPAPDGTSVTFEVSGALPADPRTLLTLRLPGFELYLENVIDPTRMTLEPLVTVPGATQFAYTVGWGGAPRLMAGERVVVLQSLASPVNPTTTRWSVARGGSVEVATIDARNVRAAVGLADLPPLAAPVPPSTFDFGPLVTVLDGLLPNSTLGGVFLNTVAAPSGLRSDIRVQTVYSTAAGVLDAPALAVDPLGGLPWQARYEVQVLHRSTLNLPGVAQAIPIPLRTSFSGPADEAGWYTTAQLHPTAEVRANSADGGTVLTGDLLSTTPLLTWPPPTRGRALRYFVSFITIDIDDDGNLTLQPDLGVFITYFEAVLFPPGVLAPNSRYVFIVEAEACGAAPDSSPFRRADETTCARASTRSLLFNTP